MGDSPEKEEEDYLIHNATNIIKQQEKKDIDFNFKINKDINDGQIKKISIPIEVVNSNNLENRSNSNNSLIFNNISNTNIVRCNSNLDNTQIISDLKNSIPQINLNKPDTTHKIKINENVANKKNRKIIDDDEEDEISPNQKYSDGKISEEIQLNDGIPSTKIKIAITSEIQEVISNHYEEGKKSTNSNEKIDKEVKKLPSNTIELDKNKLGLKAQQVIKSCNQEKNNVELKIKEESSLQKQTLTKKFNSVDITTNKNNNPVLNAYQLEKVTDKQSNINISLNTNKKESILNSNSSHKFNKTSNNIHKIQVHPNKNNNTIPPNITRTTLIPCKNN